MNQSIHPSIHIHESIHLKGVALAENHKIDASELASTWEAHSLNHNVDNLTDQTFSSYRAQIIQQRNKISKSKSKAEITPTPTKPMKRERERVAVVSRPAMTKRSAPSSASDADLVSPNKRRASGSVSNNNPHSQSQLEQIVNSVNTASPLKSSRIGSTTTSVSVSGSVSGKGESPHSAIITPPKPSAKPSLSYENRTNAGTTILTYNPNNLPSIQSNTTTSTSTSTSTSTNTSRICQITQPFHHIKSTYKHMTDATRHTHLDAQLRSMMEQMMEAYHIPLPSEDEDEHNAEADTEATIGTNGDSNANANANAKTRTLAPYENVGVPRQSLQTNIGRICNEAHNGKLNKTTLLLEGSRHGSNGARIELDVEKLSNAHGGSASASASANFSLFQGQIVCVEGYNQSGRRMVVERLMEGLPVHASSDGNDNANDNANANANGLEKTAKSLVREMHHGEGKGCQNGNAVKIYAAAGPYTTSQDLDYQPLMDLLGTIEAETPDVVILMGPFVDMRQDKVQSGEELTVEYEDGTKRHVCFEQFFAAKIASELENMYESNPGLKTQFVLVPSMDDAIAEPV